MTDTIEQHIEHLDREGYTIIVDAFDTATAHSLRDDPHHDRSRPPSSRAPGAVTASGSPSLDGSASAGWPSNSSRHQIAFMTAPRNCAPSAAALSVIVPIYR